MTMTAIEPIEVMDNKEKRAPILDSISNCDLSRVAIIGGAGVDPDGLASVEAMAAIISILNPDAEIEKYYNGEFDRPQNRTMRELLRLTQKSVSKYEKGWATAVISVDGPASVCPEQPHFIIDHHPPHGEPIINSDVRPIGSCSAIMWEYCVEAGVDFATEDGAKLATALAIGICTDTKEKTTETTSDLEFEAEAFCGRYRDAKLYSGIKNYPKPHYYMDMVCYGWVRKVEEGTCMVTELGLIPKERSGVISDVAEKLSEMAGVSTSVVIAMVDGSFVGSVRTTDTSINMDEFCKSIGSGGGRGGAGKFTLEMPPLFHTIDNTGMAEEHFRSGYNIICHRILQITGDGIRSKKGE